MRERSQTPGAPTGQPPSQAALARLPLGHGVSTEKLNAALDVPDDAGSVVA